MQFPKRIPFRSPKARAAAEGEDCTLRLPGCRNDTTTTVLCHSNRMEHGKGKGQKADDDKAAFGCWHCHDLLDARSRWPGLTKEMIEMEFDRAMGETQAILKAKGIL